jgi:hypothetical protein
MYARLSRNNLRTSSMPSLGTGNVTASARQSFAPSQLRDEDVGGSLPNLIGELEHPFTVATHLRNGSRTYSPALRRFSCSDSESTFSTSASESCLDGSADSLNQTDIGEAIPKPTGGPVQVGATPVEGGRFVDYHFYTDNYLGKGEEALSIHGDKQGNLYFGETVSKNQNGLWETDEGPFRVSGTELPQALLADYGIDLYQKPDQPVRPLHLVSCHAKRGAAQELANEIDRPVIAYSKHLIWIPGNYHQAIETDHQVTASYRRPFSFLSHKANPEVFYPEWKKFTRRL